MGVLRQDRVRYLIREYDQLTGSDTVPGTHRGEMAAHLGYEKSGARRAGRERATRRSPAAHPRIPAREARRRTRPVRLVRVGSRPAVPRLWRDDAHPVLQGTYAHIGVTDYGG